MTTIAFTVDYLELLQSDLLLVHERRRDLSPVLQAVDWKEHARLVGITLEQLRAAAPEITRILLSSSVEEKNKTPSSS